MSVHQHRRLRTAAVTTALVAGLATGLVTLPASVATAATRPGPAATFGKQLLTAQFDAQTATVRRGADFTVSGTISKVTQDVVGRPGQGVPARFTLAVTDATGRVLGTQDVTAAGDGTFSTTVPGAVSRSLPRSNAPLQLGLRALDASYASYQASDAGAGSTNVAPATPGLSIVDSFVSSVGWVKPGETYPSRIIVSNTSITPTTATVTVNAPAGSTITDASGPGTHTVAPQQVQWTVPVDGYTPSDGPGTATLVLMSRAASTTAMPTIVWRDLSTTATLAETSPTTVTSHGPKVIPPDTAYDTARYGDRPFPVVPIQYTDRKYQTTHSGEGLAAKINDPSVAGSTFNLYQEMSLGQLFPHGTVPSAGIATADFASYGPGFPFTKTVPTQLNTCHGHTYADSPVNPQGTALYPARITNGVYNLPGDTDYYGDDSNGSAILGAEAGVGTLQNIDSGCGTTGKIVADAVAIADPEIDYSDYDTDKDGVVDFFMGVFAGCGGNGASQLGACTDAQSDTAPYDNIWPHSSSLEYYYSDPVTGLPGITTDDQLKDLEGRPLYWTDTTYKAKTTTVTTHPVYVRVGPYNLNPETAIDKASVISHEYGHSLGLPDFYSTGSRQTYGDWNLMATDKSQNMDAYSRQELGWVVPEVLNNSETRTVNNWTDSKQDTGVIHWQSADGTPYTLTNGADGIVHNSQMFVAKLPGRQLLDPAAFDTGDKASASHAWWSGSGNDFGCAPDAARNLDLAIPGLATLPAGSTVNLSFKSRWDIEWDFDYGFVMTTSDGGKTYTSHKSDNGYTTSNAGVPGNPNQNACQAKYDNGITGTSGSYDAGTDTPDRLTGSYPDPVFVKDSYDISDLAGKATGALRFSYATDPGLARPGWFIDDVKVVATLPNGGGEKVLFNSDLETTGGPTDPAVYNGGCRENLTVAQQCTLGWTYLQAGAESKQDHAYYLEMRDRSGFDDDGHGQIDRDPIGWDPGLYLAYTDEAHGYGNAGTDDPPAQSPLDSVPTPGSATPNLNDAAFVATKARSVYSDAGEGHTDNYVNPAETSVDPRYPSKKTPWRFQYNCLGFKVLQLSGTDVGPQTSDGNLTGDVRFTMGTGCSTFDYGYTSPTPVSNTAPTAKAAADRQTATTDEPVAFNGAGTTDAETPANLDYSWDFGDGGSTKDAAGREVSHTFTAPGTYAVTLLVTDPSGATDTDQVSVTVTESPANQDPTAVMRVKPGSPVQHRRVTLSARGSSDPETAAGNLVYEWNFDDGGATVDAVGRVVRTRFDLAGARQVTLTVRDGDGGTDSVTQRVVVRHEVQCGSGRVREHGSWQMVASRDARGGAYCDNAGSGRGRDVLRMGFAGSDLDITHARSAEGGKARVFVDGNRVGVIRFDGSSQAPQLGFHTAFADLGPGKHQLRLVVLRGRAYIDGFFF